MFLWLECPELDTNRKNHWLATIKEQLKNGGIDHVTRNYGVTVAAYLQLLKEHSSCTEGQCNHSMGNQWPVCPTLSSKVMVNLLKMVDTFAKTQKGDTRQKAVEVEKAYGLKIAAFWLLSQGQVP